jgi:hypothetical protein
VAAEAILVLVEETKILQDQDLASPIIRAMIHLVTEKDQVVKALRDQVHARDLVADNALNHVVALAKDHQIRAVALVQDALNQHAQVLVADNALNRVAALAKDHHRATAIQLLEILKNRQDQQEKAHLLETEDHPAIENLSAPTEDLAAADQPLEKLGRV